MTVVVEHNSTIAELVKDEPKKPGEEAPVRVDVRLMFLRVGTIETHCERYAAYVAVESHWRADASFLATLTSNQIAALDQDEQLSLVGNYKGWHPHIFILNRDVGSIDETTHYSLKRHHETKQIEVRELRIFEGRFLCDFDLHHYPTDTQELNISIGSNLSDKKVQLYADPYNLSGVNKESFAAQHEWILYEHVETTPSWVKGYIFRHDLDGGGDLYVPGYPKTRGTLKITLFLLESFLDLIFVLGHWLQLVCSYCRLDTAATRHSLQFITQPNCIPMDNQRVACTLYVKADGGLLSASLGIAHFSSKM
ncbi:hypothetical protein I4U23_021866 [Adineta vaga]|nr:hypothetical protein I4U23_021866 [Adineta vaga]